MVVQQSLGTVSCTKRRRHLNPLSISFTRDLNTVRRMLVLLKKNTSSLNIGKTSRSRERERKRHPFEFPEKLSAKVLIFNYGYAKQRGTTRAVQILG